jgi:hypothetical protein
MAELALAKPPVNGLKRKAAQWLRPELRVRVQHPKARGTRHASVKQIITIDPWRAAARRPTVRIAFRTPM